MTSNLPASAERELERRAKHKLAVLRHVEEVSGGDREDPVKETRWKLYEKQRPGHALQVDVKFIEPLGQTGRKKRYYQYTAIDNGKEFGQVFHWHLLGKGIGHIDIKPATPRLNGKVKRSHRIGSEDFYRLLEGQVIDDVNLFSDKLQ